MSRTRTDESSNSPINFGEEQGSFKLQRRTFLQIFGSGILITVFDGRIYAQNGSTPLPVAARLFLNKDGTITALSGKVEEGQGPRTELTQAAAEELRLAVDRVHLVMADTDLVPDDGITAGSRTTPRNVPEMRQAAATARELLTQLAARQWQVDSSELAVRHGPVEKGPADQDPCGQVDQKEHIEDHRYVNSSLSS